MGLSLTTKEQIKERSRRYYLHHRVEVLERSNDYNKKHKKERTKYMKKWRGKNRERDSQNKKQRRESLKKQIFELLGKICIKCKFSDEKALEIDHIHGNGREERKKFRSCSITYLNHIFKELRAGSKDYQLLCANCNRIKEYENNEWGVVFDD